MQAYPYSEHLRSMKDVRKHKRETCAEKGLLDWVSLFRICVVWLMRDIFYSENGTIAQEKEEKR